MVGMAVATTEDIMAGIMEDITGAIITIMVDMAGGEQAWD